MVFWNSKFDKKKLIVLSLLTILLLIMLSLAAFSLTDKQIPLSFFGGAELPSPGDWVKEEQIKVYPNKIILDVKDDTWGGFTDTNSMDPFIDAQANALEILPKDANAINVGDVISYQSGYGVIIHRVIEKNQDQQ